MRVHQIYPTSVAEDQIVPNQDLVNHINNLELVPHGEPQENLDNIFGLRSKNTYIFDDPIFKQLKSQFEKKALWFMREKMERDVTEARMLQSWVSLKRPGQSHVRHRHSNAVVCGVWWFEYDELNPPMPLYLHRSGLSFSNSFAVKSSKTDWCYEPHASGVYVLFPGDTYHSVPMNTTKKDRRSIAFNIGVSDNIGYENSFNEMKFERLV
ncbi:MAG: putative 2OG-Fe(II) oxygenase [Candidatus Poseidoniales archaeon]|jgi:uncharacterized protein (TIGR02466 family)